MAKASKKTNDIEHVDIIQVRHELVTYRVLGETPLFMNRQTEKVWRELVLPSLKKNDAERAATLKHNPIEEFRASVYRSFDPKTKALLCFPSNAFHEAIQDTAIDIPGAFKSQIGRLTVCTSINTEIFGVPQLKASPVRMANQQRTPDIRFRAMFPEWACQIQIRYISTLIREANVTNLMAAAGMIQGIGDWRPGKGNGSYGQWQLVNADDEDWNRIVAKQGRAAQQAALDTPIFADPESEDICTWFAEELKRRREAPPQLPRRKKKEPAKDEVAGELDPVMDVAAMVSAVRNKRDRANASKTNGRRK